MYIQHVHLLYQTSRVKPSAPPVPNETDTLQFLDEVIASCDSEPKPYLDDGHADVDFIGECESLGLFVHKMSAGQELWCLRTPAPEHTMEQSAPTVQIKVGVIRSVSQTAQTSARQLI